MRCLQLMRCSRKEGGQKKRRGANLTRRPSVVCVIVMLFNFPRDTPVLKIPIRGPRTGYMWFAGFDPIQSASRYTVTRSIFLVREYKHLQEGPRLLCLSGAVGAKFELHDRVSQIALWAQSRRGVTCIYNHKVRASCLQHTY